MKIKFRKVPPNTDREDWKIDVMRFDEDEYPKVDRFTVYLSFFHLIEKLQGKKKDVTIEIVKEKTDHCIMVVSFFQNYWLYYNKGNGGHATVCQSTFDLFFMRLEGFRDNEMIYFKILD